MKLGLIQQHYCLESFQLRQELCYVLLLSAANSQLGSAGQSSIYDELANGRRYNMKDKWLSSKPIVAVVSKM